MMNAISAATVIAAAATTPTVIPAMAPPERELLLEETEVAVDELEGVAEDEALVFRFWKMASRSVLLKPLSG